MYKVIYRYGASEMLTHEYNECLVPNVGTQVIVMSPWEASKRKYTYKVTSVLIDHSTQTINVELSNPIQMRN